MRLRQYLNELSMKADTNIDIKKAKGKYFNALITLEDGTQWLYNAEIGMDDIEWLISFYAPSDKTQDIKDRSKVAVETFAAVIHLTEQFLKQEKPEAFAFQAMGRSRTKLYDLLAKKITKTGKYKLSIDRGLGRSSNYRFERK